MPNQSLLYGIRPQLAGRVQITIKTASRPNTKVTSLRFRSTRSRLRNKIRPVNSSSGRAYRWYPNCFSQIAYDATKNRLWSQNWRNSTMLPVSGAPDGPRAGRSALTTNATGSNATTNANLASRNGTSLVGCIPRSHANGYVIAAVRSDPGMNLVSAKLARSNRGDAKTSLKYGEIGLPKASQ